MDTQSFTYSFIQPILAECLQGIRGCSRLSSYSCEEDKQGSLLKELTFWWQKVLQISLSNQVFIQKIGTTVSLKGFKLQNDMARFLIWKDHASLDRCKCGSRYLMAIIRTVVTMLVGIFDDWLI